jgi:Fic family protein
MLNKIQSCLDPRIIKRIEEKKQLLDKHRPLPKSALQKLQENFIIEWTYNSNAIEGNTLSLGETRLVLETGITINGKPLKDHLEAINHKEAIIYLLELIKRNKKIDEQLIRNIHGIVVQNIEKEYAGRFRSGQVRILGANFIPPNYLKIPNLINDLIIWLNGEGKKLYLLDKTAIFHHRFETIHPFYDGNGRTGRLLMNLILMQKGYPPVIIANTDRKKYLNALNKANQQDYSALTLLIAVSLEKYLDLYLESIAFATKFNQELVPLRELVKKTKMGLEYLSLLARQGKIHAVKNGKTWYSSEDNINNYLKHKLRE